MIFFQLFKIISEIRKYVFHLKSAFLAILQSWACSARSAGGPALSKSLRLYDQAQTGQKCFDYAIRKEFQYAHFGNKHTKKLASLSKET